jgi:hypothetical protein
VFPVVTDTLLNKSSEAPVLNTVGWVMPVFKQNQNAAGDALGLLTKVVPNVETWFPNTVTLPAKPLPLTISVRKGGVDVPDVNSQKLGYVNDEDTVD